MDVGNALARASRRTKIGRKLSRRLSLVTKVPNMISVKLKQELGGSRDNLRTSRASQPRNFEITTIAPDKTQRILPTCSPTLVRELVAPLLLEFGLKECRLLLAGSSARVDPEADVSLLEGDVLIIEDANKLLDLRGDSDARFRLTEILLNEEREYGALLGSAKELYGGPLKKLSCLADDEHQLLFGGLADLSALSKDLCNQIHEVLDSWDSESSTIGQLFSNKFWTQYHEFQESYRKARELLREKTATDDEFVEFCKLRRGAAQDTLETLLDLPVQRLAQYEQYIQSILRETRHDHADNEDVSRAKTKAKQAVKRGQEESDLERIQDLFPNDCLRLYDKDVVTMKMKGLIRKRSTTASRLQRALSAKALRPGAGDSPADPSSPQSPGNRDQGLPRSGQEKRQFLMEAPVQFTTGVQSQERHLFLFNDLLLVAKARSGGNFKLKEKVRVSEMWLTRVAMNDVIEVNKSFETSFVMGWPTTNVVATFSTQAARDLWWNKLNEVVEAERGKEPRSTNIQVVFYDCATSIEYIKTFSIGPDETARTCIRLALEHLEMRGLDPDDFQLWAKTAREESPYPLIGHERLFAIKLSCLRDGLSTEEGFDLDHCNNVHGPDPLAKCQFILRSKRKASECSTSSVDTKKTAVLTNSSKKSRKSPMRIRQVFRRSTSKGEDCTDCPSSPVASPAATGALFGIPLSRLGDPDTIPRPVMTMLQQVFLKGPFTQGIFRKSANARMVRELRERLDSGSEIAMDHISVLAVAALLKEFLRSLPDPLLGSALYPLYMEALECRDEQEKLIRVKSVLEQLPCSNVTLLSHFLCVLHHIDKRSQHNLMSATNLGVCVGPSLLWSHTPTPASSRAVPNLVELLISRCELLLGPQVPLLMGDPPERDPTRQDSGAEESDSLHSGGLRRDDSSIDSLERELMEPCPPPRKDKMSLSRDSGLTMSDSQLYTPDEEESGSTSSGSGRALYPPAQQPSCYNIHAHNKVTSSYSVPAATSTPNSRQASESQPVIGSAPAREYVRVYGGWEERVQECCNRGPWPEDSIYARPAQTQSGSSQTAVINPNFQRQDWFRQRSHLKRLNSGGSGSGSGKSGTHTTTTSGSSSGSASSGVGGLHRHAYRSPIPGMRRSASDESLLNDTAAEQHTYNDRDVSGLLKRPALHRKGRAPPPPPPPPIPATVSPPEPLDTLSYSCYPGTPILRSKSMHLLFDTDTPSCTYENSTLTGTLLEKGDATTSHRKQMHVTPEDWSRSRSTPHIAATSLDDADRSYDSSTLSDDDSTPHVSRSNSRGKDCAAANSAWESAYGSTPAPELLVHAAPINIREDNSDSEVHQIPPPVPPSPPRHHSDSAPPLPPKRSSIDIKLRHLPPVHVDTPTPRHNSVPSEETLQWDEGQTPRKAPERKGRLRHRENGAKTAQRSKSLPPPPGESRSDTIDDGEGDSEDVRKLSTASTIPSSNLRAEIAWSVSQLRSLFSDGTRPPPYRPPPSVIPSHRAPITTYHLGNSQSERYVISRRLLLDPGPRLRGVDSTDEEESYV